MSSSQEVRWPSAEERAAHARFMGERGHPDMNKVVYIAGSTKVGMRIPVKVRNSGVRYYAFIHSFTFFLLLLSHCYFPASGQAVVLSSFWTSRGHTCRPFPPPVRAFIFIAHRIQHSLCSSIFIECC